MRKTYLFVLTLVASTISTSIYSQGLLDKIGNAAKKASNAVDKIVKTDYPLNSDKLDNAVSSNNQSYSTNTKKTELHKKNVGKIIFAKGSVDDNFNNESQIIQSTNLSEPVHVISYYESSLPNLMKKNGNDNSITRAIYKKFYVDGVLIVETGQEVRQDEFELYNEKSFYINPLVPADKSEFDENKFQIATFTHVLSGLNPGKHTLKIEDCIIDSKKQSSTNEKFSNPATIVIASGEIEINVDAAGLNSYIDKYARPKFGKGLLASDKELETSVKNMIQGFGETPIYVYGDDNWILKRNEFGRVINREAQMYYIKKNNKGKCEMKDFRISQKYDGSKYYPATEILSKSSPGFKFVACEKYK